MPALPGRPHPPPACRGRREPPLRTPTSRPAPASEPHVPPWSQRLDVRRLSVKRLVEADFLGPESDLDRGHPVDEPKHAEREYERPYGGQQHGNALLDEERRVAREQSVGARRVELPGGEHPEHDDADETAHPVHAPHVERV